MAFFELRSACNLCDFTSDEYDINAEVRPTENSQNVEEKSRYSNVHFIQYVPNVTKKRIKMLSLKMLDRRH